MNQNVEKRSCLLASLAGALTGSGVGYSLPVAGVTWKANKLRERERERGREGEKGERERRERGREGEPA